MSINSLLKLEFFKSLGFASKENGMEFIKINPKLQKTIQSKVDENNEQTYLLLQELKDNVFCKFDDKKDLFIIKSKNEKGDKLAYKKELQKMSLKEEMRDEILLEIKNEQNQLNQSRLQNKFPKCIPEYQTVDLNILNTLFITAVSQIDNGQIDKDEIKSIEKAKEQVEKAMAMLLKASNTLESLINN